MASRSNVANFRQLVDDLMVIAVHAPNDWQGRLASRSICAFAMLNAEPGGPNTLEGAEVARIIENAVRLAVVDPDHDLAPSKAMQ